MSIKRIAINAGVLCAGLNWVVYGAARAAREQSCELIGIRDGYEGLLFPGRYPQGGYFPITEATAGVENTDDLLPGHSPADPFRLQELEPEGQFVEERDRSDELLGALQSAGIDAVISIVGRRAMSVAWKLHRKGLPTVCVPVSVENDLAATGLSFGFNTALSFTVDLLDRARQTAIATRRTAVVEVLGTHAGWLALQAGIAARADAIVIPEYPCDPERLAAQLARGGSSHHPPALVVAAEGTYRPALQNHETGAARTPSAGGGPDALELTRRAQSAGSSTGDPQHIIRHSGAMARYLALELGRRLAIDTFDVSLGQMLRAGTPTPTDRQLGMAYGASAVLGLTHAASSGTTGSVVAFHPPRMEFVPFAEAVNHNRQVSPGSDLIQAARAMGIVLGD